MITIKIDTGNAVFEGDNKEFELARILRQIADKLEQGRQVKRIFDINGNAVGYYTEEEEEEGE